MHGIFYPLACFVADNRFFATVRGHRAGRFHLLSTLRNKRSLLEHNRATKPHIVDVNGPCGVQLSIMLRTRTVAIGSKAAAGSRTSIPSDLSSNLSGLYGRGHCEE